MSGEKEEARAAPEEGVGPQEPIYEPEDSLARFRRQQESRLQLCELS
jgi:hypothetical protein